MYLDLHVHLRGTIGPSLAQRLARRGNLVLDAALFHTGRYMWSDFSGFLSAYDAVAAVVQNAGDLEEVAFSYLARSMHEGWRV
jgi:adenosine deaminase